MVWESYQDRTAFNGINRNPADAPDSFGIYGQQYVRNSLVGVAPYTGLNGEFQSEFAVNTTKDGDQRYPSIAMDDNGDFLVVWSGYRQRAGPTDQSDTQGVFMQRFDQPTDTAGPIVINTFAQTRRRLREGLLRANTWETRTACTSSSSLSARICPRSATWGGPHSVLNLDNWNLTLNGATIFQGVSHVDFGLNQAYMSGLVATPSNKYEAVLTFDGNPSASRQPAAGHGDLHPDRQRRHPGPVRQRLGRRRQRRPGRQLHPHVLGVLLGCRPRPRRPAPIRSSTAVPGAVQPDVAANAAGSYVVVWTTYGQGGDVVDQRQHHGPAVRQQRPVGGQFAVNTFTAGSQTNPVVAMDDYGNFVVAWSGAGRRRRFGRLLSRLRFDTARP